MDAIWQLICGSSSQAQSRPSAFSWVWGNMKVMVLGAGIIGITSPYQLAKAGHEVTIIERQPGAALETSFANAGEVSFGYCSPWAAPGIPLKTVKWLFMHHSPLILRPKVDMAIAGLRCHAMGVPWIIDAPMNKVRFETYAETQLAPELQPGGVVILDNVAFHKGEEPPSLFVNVAPGSASAALFP
jgi:hypothetical protein